jgi:hypothetical protein
MVGTPSDAFASGDLPTLHFISVMAGLFPAIHAFLAVAVKDVDARHNGVC